MPTQDPFDAYFNDPEFRGLSGSDKIAILSRIDPDFAQLPIKEQATVVQKYLNPPKEDTGVLGTLADALGGTVQSIVHPIDALRSATAARQQEQQRAKEAFHQGHYTEAFGHGLAGAIPFIGPMAAQAGEDIGEGRTAQGLTEAGLALGPSVVGISRPAVNAAARTGAGFVKGAAKAAPRAARAAAASYGPYISALEYGAGLAGIEHNPAAAAGLAAAGIAPAVPDIVRGGVQGAREGFFRYPNPAGPIVPKGGLPPDIRPLYGPTKEPFDVQIGGPFDLTPPSGSYYNWKGPQIEANFPPPPTRTAREYAASQQSKQGGPIDLTNPYQQTQIMHRAGPTSGAHGQTWFAADPAYAANYGEPTAHAVSFSSPLDLRDIPADARYSANDFGALLEARGVRMTPELKAQMKQVEASGDGKAYPFMFTRSPEFTKAVQDSGFDITHLNEKFGNGPSAQTSFVSNPNQIQTLGPSALVPPTNIPLPFEPGPTIMPTATGYPQTVGMHNAVTLSRDIGQPLQEGINFIKGLGQIPKWGSHQ